MYVAVLILIAICLAMYHEWQVENECILNAHVNDKDEHEEYMEWR